MTPQKDKQDVFIQYEQAYDEHQKLKKDLAHKYKNKSRMNEDGDRALAVKDMQESDQKKYHDSRNRLGKATADMWQQYKSDGTGSSKEECPLRAAARQSQAALERAGQGYESNVAAGLSDKRTVASNDCLRVSGSGDLENRQLNNKFRNPDNPDVPDADNMLEHCDKLEHDFGLSSLENKKVELKTQLETTKKEQETLKYKRNNLDSEIKSIDADTDPQKYKELSEQKQSVINNLKKKGKQRGQLQKEIAGIDKKIKVARDPNIKKGLASHAEKQVAYDHIQKGINKPIGVNREMCGDCRAFFSKMSRKQGQVIRVRDPKFERVFYPDGSVQVLDKNANLVKTIAPGTNPVADVNNYKDVIW